MLMADLTRRTLNGELSATCPHCYGRNGGTCCACHSHRIIRWMHDLTLAIACVWARPGCPCDTCRWLGPGPVASC